MRYISNLSVRKLHHLISCKIPERTFSNFVKRRLQCLDLVTNGLGTSTLTAPSRYFNTRVNKKLFTEVCLLFILLYTFYVTHYYARYIFWRTMKSGTYILYRSRSLNFKSVLRNFKIVGNWNWKPLIFRTFCQIALPILPNPKSSKFIKWSLEYLKFFAYRNYIEIASNTPI